MLTGSNQNENAYLSCPPTPFLPLSLSPSSLPVPLWQLEHFMPLVGGAEHVVCLLPVYEMVASGEEVALRSLAIDGLSKLSNVMPAQHVRTNLHQLVCRLARGQWYAQRAAACGLLHVLFPKLDAAGQKEILRCVRHLRHQALRLITPAPASSATDFG